MVSYHSAGDCASPYKLRFELVDHDFSSRGIFHAFAWCGLDPHILVNRRLQEGNSHAHLPHWPSVLARHGE